MTVAAPRPPAKRSLVGPLAGIVLVVLVVAGCAQPAPAARPRPAPAYLVDADSHGAIVWDPAAAAYVGVRRDGSVMWTDRVEADDPLNYVCAARCPAAVVANYASMTGRRIDADGSARLPGGLPLWVGDTAEEHLTYRRDGDRGQLDIAGTLVDVPAGTPFLALDVTRTAGLAVVPGPSGEAELFRINRSPGAAWRVTGRPAPVEATSACVSPHGTEYGVTSSAGLRMSTGRVIRFSRAGWCALSPDAAVVARMASGGDGGRTELAVFDTTGSVRWQRTVPALVRIRVRHGLVLVAEPGRHALLRLADGAPVPAEQLTTAHDALFVSDTELVTVRPDGHGKFRTQWIPVPR